MFNLIFNRIFGTTGSFLSIQTCQMSEVSICFLPYYPLLSTAQVIHDNPRKTRSVFTCNISQVVVQIKQKAEDEVFLLVVLEEKEKQFRYNIIRPTQPVLLQSYHC